MTSGPGETPSDCIMTSTPLRERFTAVISSASAAIFSSFAWSIGILRADRARARTECPASKAAFTASRPIPLLAPMQDCRHGLGGGGFGGLAGSMEHLNLTHSITLVGAQQKRFWDR